MLVAAERLPQPVGRVHIACRHGDPRDTLTRKFGRIYHEEETFNVRTTMGRDQIQRMQQFGDITANASSYTGVTGTITSIATATTATNTAAAFPTSGGLNGSLQGHIIVFPVAGVYGVILSNTATVITFDQLTAFNSAIGAVGSTPASGAAYAIMPGGNITPWMGLSTHNVAGAAGDVLRTADGLFADGTTGGTATEQNANGLVRTFVQPTFPSASNVQLQVIFTYTGGTVTPFVCYKVVLCNSKPAAGSLLYSDALLNAGASFATNGDNTTATYTFTL